MDQLKRLRLNGHPYPIHLMVDQGRGGGNEEEEMALFNNSDTMAASSEHLPSPTHNHWRQDVELVKAMGFNCLRVNQDRTDPRYLYWADILGLLVLKETPRGSIYAEADE